VIRVSEHVLLAALLPARFCRRAAELLAAAVPVASEYMPKPSNSTTTGSVSQHRLLAKGAAPPAAS
jgi:hypothetical protein